MNKTNKELATELAIAIIQSWNGADHTTAIKPSEAIEIARKCYNEVTSWS